MIPWKMHQGCCSLSRLRFSLLGLLLVALVTTPSSHLAAQPPQIEPHDMASTLLTLDDFPSGWQAEPITTHLPRSTDPLVCDLFTVLAPSAQEQAGIVFERGVQVVSHRVFEYPTGTASSVMDALEAAFARCTDWLLDIVEVTYQPQPLPFPSLADRSLALRFHWEESATVVPGRAPIAGGAEADLVALQRRDRLAVLLHLVVWFGAPTAPLAPELRRVDTTLTETLARRADDRLLGSEAPAVPRSPSPPRASLPDIDVAAAALTGDDLEPGYTKVYESRLSGTGYTVSFARSQPVPQTVSLMLIQEPGLAEGDPPPFLIQLVEQSIAGLAERPGISDVVVTIQEPPAVGDTAIHVTLTARDRGRPLVADTIGWRRGKIITRLHIQGRSAAPALLYAQRQDAKLVAAVATAEGP